jgi:hypothetical protein
MQSGSLGDEEATLVSTVRSRASERASLELELRSLGGP